MLYCGYGLVRTPITRLSGKEKPGSLVKNLANKYTYTLKV